MSSGPQSKAHFARVTSATGALHLVGLLREETRSLAQSAKAYDLHRARQELGEKIKKIPTLEVA